MKLLYNEKEEEKKKRRGLKKKKNISSRQYFISFVLVKTLSSLAYSFWLSNIIFGKLYKIQNLQE